MAYFKAGADLVDARLDLGGERPQRAATTTAATAATTSSLPRTTAATAAASSSLPPTAARAAYPSTLGVRVRTPNGDVTLTAAQLREQEQLVHSAVTRLGGAGRGLGVLGYIELFGLINPSAGHAFGNQVWHGLNTLWSAYVYRYRMDGAALYLGWFLCPINFSLGNAATPADQADLRNAKWYPAFFAFWSEMEDPIMACEAILLLGSKPWRIHRSRIHNAEPKHIQLLF